MRFLFFLGENFTNREKWPIMLYLFNVRWVGRSRDYRSGGGLCYSAVWGLKDALTVERLIVAAIRMFILLFA